MARPWNLATTQPRESGQINSCDWGLNIEAKLVNKTGPRPLRFRWHLSGLIPIDQHDQNDSDDNTQQDSLADSDCDGVKVWRIAADKNRAVVSSRDRTESRASTSTKYSPSKSSSEYCTNSPNQLARRTLVGLRLFPWRDMRIFDFHFCISPN